MNIVVLMVLTFRNNLDDQLYLSWCTTVSPAFINRIYRLFSQAWKVFDSNFLTLAWLFTLKVKTMLWISDVGDLIWLFDDFHAVWNSQIHSTDSILLHSGQNHMQGSRSKTWKQFVLIRWFNLILIDSHFWQLWTKLSWNYKRI